MRCNKTEAKFTSHYILKRFFRQFAINNNDVSAGKSNTKCHSIYLCRYSLRFGNLRRRNRNQLQKYLRHCTVFWHKWPVHDLVLVIPPPPLIKVASNIRPYSKLGGTTLSGREEGGQYYILQTCDQERFEARKVVFPWECLNIFATGCSIIKC